MKHSLKKILPPSAKKIPKELKRFDSKRVDNYFWLKNRDDSEVIEYLEKENDYFKKMTSNTEDFQEIIYKEIKNKIKEDDQSVPYFLNGYWYLTKYQKNKKMIITNTKHQYPLRFWGFVKTLFLIA